MFLIFSHIESIAALMCCHKLRSSSFEPGQEILIMLLTEICSKWLGKWHGTFEVFKKLWTTTEIWIPNQTHLMRTLAQTQFLCKPESGSRPSWSGFTCLVGHDKVLKESTVPLTEIPERNPQCLKRCWMWWSLKELFNPSKAKQMVQFSDLVPKRDGSIQCCIDIHWVAVHGPWLVFRALGQIIESVLLPQFYINAFLSQDYTNNSADSHPWGLDLNRPVFFIVSSTLLFELAIWNGM